MPAPTHAAHRLARRHRPQKYTAQQRMQRESESNRARYEKLRRGAGDPTNPDAPLMREKLERAQAAGKQLRSILRQSLRRDEAPKHLHDDVERRMYERLLKGRSELVTAARMLREKYGGVPSRKQNAKPLHRQQQQQRGQAATTVSDLASKAPRELLQKWRRGALVERWLYVLGKELSRRRGALDTVGEKPDAAWLKLRAAWRDIDAHWDYLGLEEDEGGPNEDDNNPVSDYSDVVDRARRAANAEKRGRRQLVPSKDMTSNNAARDLGITPSAATEGLPQERKAVFSPASDFPTQRARALWRSAKARLLDVQRRATSDLGLVRVHVAERWRPGGHNLALMARGGNWNNPWPRIPPDVVVTRQLGRMPRAIMIHP
jgi:hypothetical protein